MRSLVFYGWWVTLTSAFALFLGPIPILIFSSGVFLKPLAQDFHSGRGAISFARSLSSTALAFGLPFAGRLVDRFGARTVILLATGMAGFTLLGAYFCSRSIWQLDLIYVLLGVAICGAGPVSYCSVVAHWFDERRGLALGTMMAGLGLGAVTMPLVAQEFITRVGWRQTYVLSGAANLIVAVPVLAIFLRDKPESMGLLRDGRSHAVTTSMTDDTTSGLSWHEAWQDGSFWLLFCSFVLVSSSVQACLGHIAALVSDRGAGTQTAAFATSLFGGGVLIGRTVLGYLLDRLFAPRLAAVIFGCAAAGMALLRIASSQQLLFLAAFSIGLALGGEVDIMAFLSSRYFGLRSFGLIYGVIFAGFSLAGGLGTYAMGAAFDATGSYTLTLAIFCIATFTGAALLLRLGPYRCQAGAASARASGVEMLPSES